MRRAFTLLEVMVALGVFAIGASAALALLVAAASAGRRAEHETQAAILAEAEVSDLASDLLRDLDLTRLDAAEGGSGGTRWVFRDRPSKAYPDYVYDVAITPLDCPAPDETWAFLVEVEVRWTERGKGRSRQFSTILLKGLTHLDNPRPTPPAR